MGDAEPDDAAEPNDEVIGGVLALLGGVMAVTLLFSLLALSIRVAEGLALLTVGVVLAAFAVGGAVYAVQR